ncbi:MAG: hypothetical protein IJI66_07320 [Erysipelotrichaceae bacterium]|nr:hypothetical protein [Erysipelotrichaceae bacterium]
MKDLFIKLKKLMFFSAPDLEDMTNVRNQIIEDNRKFVIIWSTVENFYWFFCLFMSFRDIAYT